MAKILMKGNEVIAEASVQAGCKFFFGYPITPQSELVAYMARRLTEVEGGLFLQAESEVSAINMVYGASATGKRVMTSSSSPGFSLKQEGISYMVGAELPGVIVNVMRGGPGLGNIQPGQADYFQVTKGGGHGDYFLPVYAPASLQEIVDLTTVAFNVADEYRTPVVIATDGMMGQMMEPVEFPETTEIIEAAKPWAANGAVGDGPAKSVTSLFLDADGLENHNINLYMKQQAIKENEQRSESLYTENADFIVVAYGTMARIALSAVKEARAKGIKVGMIRPITLWPFPEKPFNDTVDKTRMYLTVEMSMGQMIEDVKLVVNGRTPVEFFGRAGGIVPSSEEVLEKIMEIAGGHE